MATYGITDWRKSKNISLALLPGSTTVAPLYDLSTAFPYDRHGEQYLQVALSIGGRRKLEQVMPPHWDTAESQLRLPVGCLRERARDLAATLPGAMSTALDEIDDDAIGELRAHMSPGCNGTAHRCWGRWLQHRMTGEHVAPAVASRPASG